MCKFFKFIVFIIILAFTVHIFNRVKYESYFNKKGPKGDKHQILQTYLSATLSFFNKLGVTYWIDYGTLLGFHREKAILNHDLDIDFGFLEKDAKKILSNSHLLSKELGFYDTTKRHKFYKFGLGGLGYNCDWYAYRVVDGKLDICLDYPYIGSLDARPVPTNYVFPLKKGKFYGKDIYYPNKTKRYLTYRYGYIGPNAVKKRDNSGHYIKRETAGGTYNVQPRNPLLAGCQPDSSESERLVTSVKQNGKIRHRALFSINPTRQICKGLGWNTREGGKDKPKIFLGFAFNSEVRVLEVILQELYGLIDYFILVESPKMNSGLEKPLFFNQVKDKKSFSKYLDKIIHLIDKKQYKDSWESLRNQRQLAFEKALSISTNHENDLFIMADADEIPKPPVIATLKHCTGYPTHINLGSEVYLYNFGCLTDWLMKPCIATLKQIQQLGWADKIRGKPPFDSLWIDRGAWHLSSFMSPEQIIEKIRGYSHQERNTRQHRNLDSIKEMISQCRYLNDKDYGYSVKVHDNALPKSVVQNKKRYRDWFPDQNSSKEFDLTKYRLNHSDYSIKDYPKQICKRFQPPNKVKSLVKASRAKAKLEKFVSTKLPIQVEQVLVINLDREISRFQNVSQQCRQARIPFRRFSAIDGQTLDLEQLQKQGILKLKQNSFFNHNKQGRNSLKGSIGCALTHRAIWERVAKSGKTTLVLEDDVVIPLDFWKKFRQFSTQIPGNWDIVFLGGVRVYGKSRNKNLIKAVSTSNNYWNNCGLYAYLVNPKSAKRLLELTLPIHTYLDIQMNRQYNQLKVYYIVPNLIRHDFSVKSSRNIGSNNGSKGYYYPSGFIKRSEVVTRI